MDIGEILSLKRQRTRTVYLLLDDGLAAERDRLVTEASVAERLDSWLNERPKAPAIKERIEELDKEILESQVPFTFGAMPRTRWVELVEEYTDPADGELVIEEFGPWMIADSSVDPKMTHDDVVHLWESWSAAETEQLYIAAFRVNREVRDIPFTSVGTEPTEISDENSITASREE